MQRLSRGLSFGFGDGKRKKNLIEQPACMAGSEPSRNTGRSASPHSLHQPELLMSWKQQEESPSWPLYGNCGRLLSVGRFYCVVCDCWGKAKCYGMSSQDRVGLCGEGGLLVPILCEGREVFLSLQICWNNLPCHLALQLGKQMSPLLTPYLQCS